MEIQQIVRTYLQLRDQHRTMALATVVQVHGSSYRSPGARMLITGDGTWIGSISGGCLEGDALRKSRNIIASGKAQIFTYDTRNDQSGMVLGLGCNGIIDILIEPVNTEHENIIDAFGYFERSASPGAMGLVIRSAHPEILPGGRILIHSDNIIQNLNFPEEKAQSINSSLLKRLETLSSGIETHIIDGFEVVMFMETIEPALRLLIFGGGFDVQPLSYFASKLGWKVTVTDECESKAIHSNFPEADVVSLCKKELVLTEFDITPYTAAIVMSHNYNYDKEVIKQLLQKPARYMGLLGPRKRFERIIQELKNESEVSDFTAAELINSPAGVDIGADTPEEIAISIIAEIKANFRGRNAGFLKNRKAPIHDRVNEQDEILKPNTSFM